jgi:hypothetical protein
VNHALQASFDALASTLPGRVGIAVVDRDGSLLSLGDWSAGVAWSTSKVPLAVAAVRAGSAGHDQLIAAITRSDNTAAEELWSQLGERAAHLVNAVIREAGDSTTVVESRRLRAEYTPFGQTRWSLTDQARFAAGLSQVPGASSVIDLMGNLSADHRWGLAAQGCAAKGGWGPGVGGDYLVRQLAVVSGSVGIALAADGVDGAYETGVAVVNALSDWVVDEVLTKD